MRTMVVGLIFGATFGSTALAGAADPPSQPGVVFARTLAASTRLEPVSDIRSVRTIDRVARGLQSRSIADSAPGGLGDWSFDVQVFGVTPKVDVLDAFDLGPVAPAAIGPPAHREWLAQLTPPAFRSTAPFWPLRPGFGW